MGIAGARAREGAPVPFVVSLSAASAKTVTVDYATSTAGGDTAAGGDFTETSGTLTFTPGQTRKTFTVPTVADDVDEENETFTVTLSNPNNATLAPGAATATGTIAEGKVVVSLEFPEGGDTLRADAGRDVVYRFRIDWGADEAAWIGPDAFQRSVPVQYRFDWLRSPPAAGGEQSRGGLAIIGRDLDGDGSVYTWTKRLKTGGFRRIGPVLIVLEDGADFETGSPAALCVEFGDGEQACPANWRAIAGRPILSVGDATASEGDTQISFPVTLTHGADTAMTLHYTVVGVSEDGTLHQLTRPLDESPRGAVSPADLVLPGGPNGTLRIPAGATEANIVVGIVDDSVDEPTETMLVLVTTNLSEAYVYDYEAMGTIFDGAATANATQADEPEAPLTAEFSDLPASHDGERAFTFELSLSEDIEGLSHATVRDRVLDVTGGRVTNARRLAAPSNRRWEVTVAPGGDAEVSIVLPPTADCAAAGALCAADGRMLANGRAALVPGPAAEPAPEPEPEPEPDLTVRFERVPDTHDGTNPVVFRIAFSEEPASDYSYATLRDSTLNVWQGSRLEVRKVRRLAAPSNRRWEVTVEPVSNADITVGLGPTHDCADNGAVCTGDGRMLANPLHKVIQGPPAISVADAGVDEAQGATVDFAVSLSRASTQTVTVNYATADGTAAAGEDYTAASGALTFTAGQTAKTVPVTVLGDSHDEGEETFTLTLSSPAGGNAWLSDATAAGTIRNTGPMPRAWLARFGRTASMHALGALETRLESGSQSNHLTMGGRRIDQLTSTYRNSLPGGNEPVAGSATNGLFGDDSLFGDEGSEAGDSGGGMEDSLNAGSPREGGPREGGRPGPHEQPLAGDTQSLTTTAPSALSLDTKAPPSHSSGGAAALAAALGLPDLRNGLMGSSFFYSPGQNGEGDDSGAKGWLGQWSAWGNTAWTRFSGADGALTISGDVRTALLGVDWEWNQWLAGVMLASSRGRGSYAHQLDAGGTLSSTLTSVVPYGRYTLNERTRFWGMVGFGAGELSLTPQRAESAIHTGMRNTMAAVGGRGVLSTRFGSAGSFELAVRSDAVLTHTTSRETANLASGAGAASRVRAVLEGAGNLPLAAGATLRPTLQAGLRYDGGGAETGAGLEVGGGLAYAMGRLALEVSARGLVAHADNDYKEWGMSGSISYRPQDDGRGLSLRVGSTWGMTQSGVNALWAQESASGLARGAPMDAAQRFQIEVQYGLDDARGLGRWTPFAGVQSGIGQQALRLGVNFISGEKVTAGLEFGQQSNHSAESDYVVQLTSVIRW